MKGEFQINEKYAPKTWIKFKSWHKAATANLDPLSAEERFVKLGGQLPKSKKKKDDVDSKSNNKELE